ncbi:hypothetical protein ACF3NA_07400 [Alkanindiges sp. WGS2144]|uniref:hypothetical protein n=1 Tax=Alkanindiges sp. WGS2144 TaxID=3366808 RepID=UPI0037508FD1
MMKFKHMALATSIGMLMSISATSYAEIGLTSLSDDEMAAETGQALFNMSYIAPNDTGNTRNGNVGFYKLGLEAEMELNANIRNLQLGCGGTNGAGACDIDIKNLSLSGLPDSYDANGNPVYNNGRPSTSAKLTNPFMEFAIKNPETASTREVVGFRASAEKITGLLTAGLLNSATPSSTDGIQSLSGFMRIAATTGDVTTQATKFGKGAANQAISGLIDIALFGNRGITSLPSNSKTTGITVPSMSNVEFNLPAFQVNGQRQTKAVANNVTTKIGEIPLAAGNPNYAASMFANDQLQVAVDPCVKIIVCIVDEATFKMGTGSKITNLNMNITFEQALSMIHNIPLTGTGGYLSLQQQALLWPGAYVDAADNSKTNITQMTQSDVAQKGWWMSFAEPVQLGYLQASNEVDISSVLPQVAALITQDLMKEENRIYVDFGEALGAVANNPITKQIIIDLNDYTLANPARITLENQQLKNQEVRPNCYGGLTFC